MDEALARAWIAAAAEVVRAEADRLTDLDAAIGDGDHGVNLRRGFDAAVAALGPLPSTTAGDVLGKTGTTLLSKVGGASGPLYGTVFRALGKTLRDGGSLADGLRAALDGVQKLGKAVVGDKTMVDALSPAVAAYAAAAGAGEAAAARAAADAAAEGVLATVPLQARKGRASYLGERSIGHPDPGATSTALILAALADVTARGSAR
ncbi:dihydroxyacetone kinase subunit DhaL [Dactylosporangium sp. CA-092794]|uniref:dihydroxyacetone kinase subunit DhaL n=1 Tax=Dactylosporangium sp. CA-092794 TaxID=3239929 RepID=UPI003D93E07F